MNPRIVNGLFVLVLSALGLMQASARAGLIGSAFDWQYYAGGDALSASAPGSVTGGSFVDDGGIGGTFIAPTSNGPLTIFNIVSDDTSIAFDYSVYQYDPGSPVGGWTSSPLSLSPTIFNGIAIDLSSAGSFGSVSLDLATNMAGFGESDFSSSGNQIQIDWQGLAFETSTVVKFDVSLAESDPAPEPGTASLIFLSLLSAAAAFGRRRRTRTVRGGITR